MTPRQAEALEFIRDYIASNKGVSPTMGEIADGLGTGKGSVHRILQALEDQQLIARERNRARRISIISHPMASRCPACGQPLVG